MTKSNIISMQKTLAILVVLTFAIFSKVAAQQVDVSTKFKEVHNAYLSQDTLFLDFEVLGYKDIGGDVAENIGLGKVRKIGSETYSAYDGEEIIYLKELTIDINHWDKTISISKGITEQFDYSEQYLSNINLLLDRVDTVIVSSKEQNILFSLIQKGALVEKTEVEIDTETNFINKVIYYYNIVSEEVQLDFVKVVIKYNYSNTTDIHSSYFDAGAYVKKTATGYQAVEKLKNYTVDLGIFNTQSP